MNIAYIPHNLGRSPIVASYLPHMFPNSASVSLFTCSKLAVLILRSTTSDEPFKGWNLPSGNLFLTQKLIPTLPTSLSQQSYHYWYWLACPPVCRSETRVNGIPSFGEGGHIASAVLGLSVASYPHVFERVFICRGSWTSDSQNKSNWTR